MHLEDKIKITSDQIVMKKKTGVTLCQRKVPLRVSYKLSFKKFPSIQHDRSEKSQCQSVT